MDKQLITQISRPGISSETLSEAGIRSVSADEAEQLCGKAAEGIWIPFYSVGGNPIIDNEKHYGRLRLNSPPRNGGKYHQESKTSVHAYIPPGLLQLPKNQDLVFVEGEFKAISLVEAGIPAIGISGFYGWGINHKDFGWQYVPEIHLAIYELAPARILFLGDSDTALNYQFSDAATKLAKVSRHPLILPRIPLIGSGKGIDDCRESLGAEFQSWWQSRIESAVSINEEFSSGELARIFCERELKDLTRLTDEQEADFLRRSYKLIASMANAPADAKRLEKEIAEKFCRSVGGIRDSVKLARSKMKEKAREKFKDAREKDPAWGPMFTNVTQAEDGKVIDGEPAQRFFAKLYCSENKILFEVNEGEFYLYVAETGIWAKLTRASLQQYLGDRMIAMSKEDKRYPFLDRKTNIELLNAITKQIQGIAEQVDVFNQKKDLIHCASYMVGFDGQEIEKYKFDHEFYSRNRLGIDPNFDSPPTRFLNELVIPAMSAEDVILLQKFFGLFILQDNPAQQFLILTGPGDRGKSQVVDLIRLLVGKENTGQLRTQHLSQRFEIGRLMHHSLLIGPDVPGDFLEQAGAASIKAMVGGDPIDVELKNSSASFSLLGRFNIAITCNQRLRVRLQSDFEAWERRIAIIEFSGPPPAKKIPDFGKVLFAEEGPQILAWAIEGLRMLLNDFDAAGRIVMTKEQKTIVTDFLNESQSLELFVKTRIESAKGISGLTKKEVLEAYADYCRARQWQPIPHNRQSAELDGLMLRYHQASISNSLQRPEDGKQAQGWRNVRFNTVEASIL